MSSRVFNIYGVLLQKKGDMSHPKCVLSKASGVEVPVTSKLV